MALQINSAGRWAAWGVLAAAGLASAETARAAHSTIARRDLTQDELDASTYRAAVQARTDTLSRDGLSPVALIWLLTDDATFTAIPSAIVAVTTETVLAGQSVLILTRRPEVGAEIRDGLLEVLEPARAFGGVTGHA